MKRAQRLMNTYKTFLLLFLTVTLIYSVYPVRVPTAVNFCVLRYVVSQSEEMTTPPPETCRDIESWLLAGWQEPYLAIQNLERFLATHPTHQIAQLRLGENEWKRGNEAEALAIWQQVPKMDVYFAFQGAHVAKQGEVIEAEQLADIAQLINPEPRSDKRLMYQELCQAWQNKGKPNKALPWCELSTQAVRNGWTHLALAQVQYKVREYEQALLTLEWVLEKGPPQLKGKAHQQMGETYLAAGEPQEAVRAYQAALAEEKSNKWIEMGLAQALLRSGKLKEACVYYANAHQLGYSVSPAQQRDFEACDLNASFPKEPP